MRISKEKKNLAVFVFAIFIVIFIFCCLLYGVHNLEEKSILTDGGNSLTITIVLSAAAIISVLFFAFLIVRRGIIEREVSAKLQRERELMFTAILNGMRNGVLVRDKNFNITLLNPSAREMFGISDGANPESIDEHVITFHSDQKTPYARDEFPCARVLRGEEVNDEELYISSTNERAGIWASVNAQALTYENREPYGSIVVFNDITERKQYAKEP